MGMNVKEFLSDLEYLVNIDSGTENIEGNWKVALFFQKELEQTGYQVMVESVGQKKRPVVIAVSPETDRYRFYLGGHMDTVFPDGTAAQRPFYVEGDGAYGPGTVDMKAGALLILYLAKEIRQNAPHIPLCIVLNSDEETGSRDSEHVLRHWAAKCDRVFIFEGGRKKGQFVNERKGIAKYQISVKGIASHAGTAPDQGASAIVELSSLIVKLHGLVDLERGTSMNVGLIQGGTALNMVAPAAEAMMEIRYREREEFDRIQAALQNFTKTPFLQGTTITFSQLSHDPPLVLTEKTLELMKKLRPYRLKYVKAGGISDANRLAGLDIPIIDGCGPSGGFPHSEKEFLSIKTVAKRYDLLYKILTQIK